MRPLYQYCVVLMYASQASCHLFWSEDPVGDIDPSLDQSLLLLLLNSVPEQTHKTAIEWCIVNDVGHSNLCTMSGTNTQGKYTHVYILW